MSEVLEKISSYNIFNYLFPGTLFVVLAKQLTSFDLSQENLLLAVCSYYFIGLVISRLGSLILEPLLKVVRFVSFADYSSFVSACQVDPKINTLLEVTNMYRTLCAVFIALLSLIVFEWLVVEFPISEKYAAPAVICALLTLFLFSYKKQTKYIVDRVGVSKS